MPDSALNLVDAYPAAAARSGDVPERLRRRYFTDARGGPGLGFYVDARTPTPAFRDQGRRLSTHRNDPQVIRDLVAIAGHRGWATISVRGQTGFRREVWLSARASGLAVRGYQPTERDLQDLARQLDRRRPSDPQVPAAPADPRRQAAHARLEIVEAVVHSRIVEPTAQARILAAARSRIADWLDRGARFEARPELRSTRRPDRQRDR